MQSCHTADCALNSHVGISLASGTHFPMHAEELRDSSARPESQLLFRWMWEETECQALGLEPSCPGRPKLKLRNSIMKQPESFTCGCRVCEDVLRSSRAG